MALQLAVDLYFEQQLVEHGGIPRSVVAKEFERHKVGDYGGLTIWQFAKSGSTNAYGNTRPVRTQTGDAPRDESQEQRQARWRPFWDRLELLETCGVIEYCPCLVEGEDLEAEIIHAIGWAAVTASRINSEMPFTGLQFRLRKNTIFLGPTTLTLMIR